MKARRAALVLALAVTGCGVQRAALFPAPLYPRTPELAGATLVQKTARPGVEIVALHVPAPAGRPTIVFFHGNGQQLADVTPLLGAFARARLGVYAVEYPGYGLCPGEPEERTVIDAADAALDHLHDGLGVPPRSVVLLGQSLGTGVATEMAVRRHGVGLALISPYTSVDELARHYFPLPTALTVDDHFDTLAKAPTLAMPVLIVNGTKDGLIPPRMSLELAAAFPDAAVAWVPGGHHNDLFVRAGRDIIATVVTFSEIATQ